MLGVSECGVGELQLGDEVLECYWGRRQDLGVERRHLHSRSRSLVISI